MPDFLIDSFCYQIFIIAFQSFYCEQCNKKHQSSVIDQIQSQFYKMNKMSKCHYFSAIHCFIFDVRTKYNRKLKPLKKPFKVTLKGFSLLRY